MKDIGNISDILKKSYFWDVDISPGKAVSKRLIIERIISLGTLEEMALIISYYGERNVEEILRNLNYIDPKTLNFISKYFRKSKKTFRCYKRKQLMQQHWDS